MWGDWSSSPWLPWRWRCCLQRFLDQPLDDIEGSIWARHGGTCLQVQHLGDHGRKMMEYIARALCLSPVSVPSVSHPHSPTLPFLLHLEIDELQQWVSKFWLVRTTESNLIVGSVKGTAGFFLWSKVTHSRKYISRFKYNFPFDREWAEAHDEGSKFSWV